MTGGGLTLVLVAALLHALWNLAAKRVEGDGYSFVWWYDLFSALLWMPIALVLIVRDGGTNLVTLVWASLVSGLVHIGYQLCLQTGYARADLGVVYPVARGVGPLLTMSVALAGLGERPGPLALVGGLVIVAGIVVVATARSGPREHSVSDGLRWGALTGTGIALYTLWDSHGVTGLGLDPVVYFAFATLWQTLLLTPGMRRRVGGGREGRQAAMAVLRRTWREALVIAVLSPLAYVLVLEAMRTVPVAVVAPVRESSIVVGALLGWWLFKERGLARKLLGACIVLAGIALTVA